MSIILKLLLIYDMYNLYFLSTLRSLQEPEQDSLILDNSQNGYSARTILLLEAAKLMFIDFSIARLFLKTLVHDPFIELNQPSH